MSLYLDSKLITSEKFPNNETHFPLVPGMSAPVITLNYEGDQDLMNLVFLRKHIGSNHKVVLRIPYFPYSRMDRVKYPTEIFTLKYVCDLINDLDFASVVIDEPHSDVVVALLNNVTVISSVRMMLRPAMEFMGFESNTDRLVFPDAGAEKRYSDIVGYKTLTGVKHRNFETGEIESLNLTGDNGLYDNPRKALIIDDLCSYGGTFLRAVEQLRIFGYDYVGLVVAHCERSVYKGKLLTSDVVTEDHLFGDYRHSVSRTLTFDKSIDDIFTTESLIGRTPEHNKVHIFNQGKFK